MPCPRFMLGGLCKDMTWLYRSSQVVEGAFSLFLPAITGLLLGPGDERTAALSPAA